MTRQRQCQGCGSPIVFVRSGKSRLPVDINQDPDGTLTPVDCQPGQMRFVAADEDTTDWPLYSCHLITCPSPTADDDEAKAQLPGQQQLGLKRKQAPTLAMTDLTSYRESRERGAEIGPALEAATVDA